MAAFPPGKGGGEGVEYGYKGKGVTIHSVVDAQGMPIAISVTAANASERDQTIKMLDGIKIQTGRRGRPKTRPKQLAADKGYDSKELRRERFVPRYLIAHGLIVARSVVVSLSDQLLVSLLLSLIHI